MPIRHDITLSTTEPNNEVGIIKIRQADEQTQTLVVQITENGTPRSYTGLEVFFCAKLGQSTGLGIIEQKLNPGELTNPSEGKLEYTMRAEDWQVLGKQTGYFSFRKKKGIGAYEEQFSTRDFYFNIIKNVFSDGIREILKDGSTYIWTFEDLKRRLIEFIDRSSNDWETFIDQNKEILESIDPNGEILNILNDSKGEYSSLPERLDNQFGSYLIDTEIDIGGATKNFFKPGIETLKSKIDTSLFNMLFSTDLHYDEGRQTFSLSHLVMPHVSNAIEFDGNVDAIVFGGDNIDGYQIDKKSNLKHLEQFTTKALYSCEISDVFILNGNHDDGSIRTSIFDGIMPENEVISENEFKYFFLTDEKINDEIRDENSLYFYKDYPEKKIRLIGLDSVDTPAVLENGNVKYLKQYWCGYQERQLKWLAEEALQNVPVDYHTMIVTHVHLSRTDKDNGNGTFEYHPNHGILISIIDAFKGGMLFQANSSLEDYEVNFTADFTQQGPRAFIAFINGHCHTNSIRQVGTFTNVWCDRSRIRTAADVGTENQDSFNVFSVDTANRTVSIYGFGRSDDTEFYY